MEENADEITSPTTTASAMVHPNDAAVGRPNHVFAAETAAEQSTAECAYGRRAEKGEEAELRCLYRNVEFVNQEEGEITCHT